MEEAADSQTEPFDTPVEFRGSTIIISIGIIHVSIGILHGTRYVILQHLSYCGRV